MSYCLQPVCEHPQNPEGASYCLSCESKLLLQERYRALKPIARGGFGRTFLAVDEFHPFQQRSVIKQFFPHLRTHDKQQAVELFRQEALRLEVLGQHPQIPRLLLYHEQDGQQYLVQEFIDGQNLAQELAENGAFDEAQIQQLLNDLLPVLQFVHDHQVIHRDIKPANIIRRTSPPGKGGAGGDLVLVDFGAAKYATGTALAKTGTVIGSAEYTAPEQVKGKAVFASDLYSLGVTCIYLLTQVSPFDLYDSSEDVWVWRDYLNHPVSESLGRVLDKLLQNATKRRYQSAREVLEDLNFEPTPVATRSLQPAKANNEENLGLQEPAKPASPLPQAAPVLSATVFDPQTQSWYRIPNLAEPSDFVLSVAMFLRQRAEISSRYLDSRHNASSCSSIPVSKKRKRPWWFLISLGAAGVAVFTAIVRLQLPLNSSVTEPSILRVETQTD